MKIHCVRNAEDSIALCGEPDMPPAFDLFTRSWQIWRLRFPKQEACASCESLWKPIALGMQRESFLLNRKFGLV